MSTLKQDVQGSIVRIGLNRPEARNAINAEMVQELTAVLNELAGADQVRVVILHGAGEKVFASGADIRELRERSHRDAFLQINASLFQRLEDFPKPTIAAIEGFALGGGLELALACDLRVAARSARLGLPETSLGIFPAAGGTWRLPRLVGLGRAKELVFTGRILEAAEAFEWGLVERLCEPGRALAVAHELASAIEKNGPLALQVAKVALNTSSRGADPRSVEQLGQALLFDSPDKSERMSAFLEKRARKTNER